MRPPTREHHFVVTWSEDYGWGVDMTTLQLWAPDGNVWDELAEEWLPGDDEELIQELERRLGLRP